MKKHKDKFHFKWWKIKGFHDAYHMWITVIPNYLN